MERTVGRTVLRVLRGDITRVAVDAVVNAANTRLWMGGGVAGAIKRAGGAEIEREAVARGPIGLGEAVATGAGRLPCRHVIHAATMGPDLVTSGDIIRRATRSSLEVADRLRVASVAFPALGTGVGGFPMDEAARLMVSEVVAYLQAVSTGLREIVFVVTTDDARRAFEAALRQIPGPPAAGDSGRSR
ncbi:MAG: macro domain-containing protein [Armatimonadota bacterium]|nr:macro domain-containing protein [Armatimonadota bacterium]MDR7400931.1 macro domain-containing protein [Armatimonadota bacterium]MDR7404751.1 macro domain-containing protein [Armatimonadota bacterium]MDR7437351.1 macro domain-containing protein [Armatimonadota bacterium]MDR7472833.1 macro domain-containing protein [Armatimonadota bacterium]